MEYLTFSLSVPERRSMQRENNFQRKVIQSLKTILPGCIVMKNDARYIQGIPDLLILYRDRWGALEVKRCLGAATQPNQLYYIERMNGMSFAKIISPENFEEVMDEIQQSLSAGR